MQGGVSAVLDPNDSVENHISDTIVAGAHLNDVEVVEVRGFPDGCPKSTRGVELVRNA